MEAGTIAVRHPRGMSVGIIMSINRIRSATCYSHAMGVEIDSARRFTENDRLVKHSNKCSHYFRNVGISPLYAVAKLATHHYR